jgi:hypothetical protein
MQRLRLVGVDIASAALGSHIRWAGVLYALCYRRERATDDDESGGQGVKSLLRHPMART